MDGPIGFGQLIPNDICPCNLFHNHEKEYCCCGKWAPERVEREVDSKEEKHGMTFFTVEEPDDQLR